MNLSSIKPVSFRLSLSIFLIVLPIFVLCFDESTVDSINKNYNFKSLNIFYKKEISEISGGIIGVLSGKIIYSDDKVNAFIIYKDTVREYVFDGTETYEIKSGSKVNARKTFSVPAELDIMGYINPLNSLQKMEHKFCEGHIVFYSNRELFDSVYLFTNFENHFDSVNVYKKNKIIIKSIYEDYETGFPKIITTFDYIKKTVEKVTHYRIVLR